MIEWLYYLHLHHKWFVMQITLYRRSFSVQESPVAYSFAPSPPGQRHTLTVGTKVYEAVFREVQITVPEGATLDRMMSLLAWKGEKGMTKSTAREVFGLAESQAAGFSVAG